MVKFGLVFFFNVYFIVVWILWVGVIKVWRSFLKVFGCEFGYVGWLRIMVVVDFMVVFLFFSKNCKLIVFIVFLNYSIVFGMVV